MGSIKFKSAVENETVKSEQVASENLVNLPQENLQESEVVKQFEDLAILFEDKVKRTENAKIFQLNNGTAKEIITSSAMHYFDEKEQRLRTIDNNLIEKEDNFETQYGKYKAEVAKDISNGKTIKFSKDNLGLEWVYLPKHSHLEGEVCHCPLMSNNMSLSPSSEVKYENIEPNVDLQYEICGNNVKENIIVKEKQEEYKFSFKLKTNGLTLKLSEDNANIELYSSKQNEQGENIQTIEFTIPAPFMFDTSKEQSDEVYYEIEPLQNDEYIFNVIANADWCNEENRVFPITIDPHIVTNDTSYFSKQTSYRNVSSGSSSGTNSGWCNTSISNIKVSKSSSMEYRTAITVKKSLINLLNHKIISAKIKLKPYSIYQSGYIRFNGSYKYYSGGTCEQDITSTFNSNTSDFTIYLEPSTYYYEYSNIEFYATGTNAPLLEIEYITNENTKSTVAEISLAGIGQGVVNLATGEVNSSLFDTTIGTHLSVPITHSYKKNSRISNYGKNWRLNIEQKLEKNNNLALDANYVFTDELGDKHAFKDKYYYLNSSNNKVYVDKSQVVAELDGRLVYSGNLVYKEQKTATGLKAITKADGFKNIDLVKQKSDEYVQLEQQVYAYKNTLVDCVVVDRYDGSIKKDFTASSFTKDNYNTNVSIASSQIILPKAEALQYKSLITQKDSLYKTVSHNEIVPNVSGLNTNIISLKNSLYQLLLSLNKYAIVRNISGFSTSVSNITILKDENFDISDSTFYESDDNEKIRVHHQALQTEKQLLRLIQVCQIYTHTEKILSQCFIKEICLYIKWWKLKLI